MSLQSIGPYEVVQKLGEGGMGAVYKARDRKLDRPVALKTILAEMTADPSRKRRFIQEARAASALNQIAPQGQEGRAAARRRVRGRRLALPDAVDEVRELARGIGGIQLPVVTVPKGTVFDIGRLLAEDSAQIPLSSSRPLVLCPTFLSDEGDDSLQLTAAVRCRLAGNRWCVARQQSRSS
jgi:hypothetical protein